MLSGHAWWPITEAPLFELRAVDFVEMLRALLLHVYGIPAVQVLTESFVLVRE